MRISFLMGMYIGKQLGSLMGTNAGPHVANILYLHQYENEYWTIMEFYL